MKRFKSMPATNVPSVIVVALLAGVIWAPESATAQTRTAAEAANRAAAAAAYVNTSPQAVSAPPTGWTCVGSCGSDGVDGFVTLSPTGNSTYQWVSTNGGLPGVGVLPSGLLGIEQNGSTLTTPIFSVTAGSPLNFYFNFVTSDGSGFVDYAWAELYNSANSPVALLFTARTVDSGSIVPGNGMPSPLATLTPASVPIIPGGPVWAPLGFDSGACFGPGCGRTGWIKSSYTIPTTGNYYLKVGVVNWKDTFFATGLAVDGVTINGVPITKPTIACNAGAGVVGVAYSGSCSASGGTPPYTWSATGLPPGLSMNLSGVISGIPTTAGTYPGTVTVTDNTSEVKQSTTQPITITITEKPTITCNTPPATAGTLYSATCTATGGTPPYTWSAPAPGLPGWLTGTPNGATITLAGTPPNPPPSSYTFDVVVTDNTSPTKQSKTQTVTINVGSTLTLSCSPPAPATGGTLYSESCAASGGTPPYSWTYSGSGTSWLGGPPSGTTVTLSGTPPNSSASYTVTATVFDSTSPTKQSKQQTITITVTASVTPLTITCSASTAATAGTVYSGNCIGSGGTQPYTWTYSGAPWVAGPSTGSAVAFAGTPPNPPPASYPFTVTVTDSTAPTKLSKSQTITINVSAPPISATITQNNSGAAPNQTNLLVQFGQAAVADYTGTLTLSFNPDVSVTNVPANYVDPSAGFPASGQSTTTLTQNFSIKTGQTQATVQFAQGTVAGTWTVTLTSLSPGGVPTPAPSFTVRIAPDVPVISTGSVRIVFNATNSGFTVQLSGFTTTREVTSATFVFSPAGSGQLTGATVTVPFNGQDQTQWFNTNAGRSAGGTFSLALPFTYSGDPSALGSVSATVNNSKGPSATVTGTK